MVVLALGVVYFFSREKQSEEMPLLDEPVLEVTTETDVAPAEPNPLPEDTEEVDVITEETAEEPIMEEVTTLVVEDLVVGTGDAVKAGDTVLMHYNGTLLDGTKFDSSYDRGQPFSVTIGVGQVIQGWDEGVPGMQVGGKRKLTIPADMAYGDRSPSPLIPAHSTLVFEVELVEIVR